MDRLFGEFPVWGIFVGTLLLVFASIELGFRWASSRQRNRELEKEAPVGAMVGATLGLLAFLLAFTFGIAADAFHARKIALVERESRADGGPACSAGRFPQPVADLIVGK